MMAKKAKKATKKVAKKIAKKVVKKAVKKTVKKVAKKTAKKATAKKATATAAKTATSAPKAKPVAKKKTKRKSAKMVAAEQELYGKWGALYKRHGSAPCAKYNMSASFEEKTAIQHKVHGWGFILKNINDRLEVLFETGIKILISNYKR